MDEKSEKYHAESEHRYFNLFYIRVSLKKQSALQKPQIIKESSLTPKSYSEDLKHTVNRAFLSPIMCPNDNYFKNPPIYF